MTQFKIKDFVMHGGFSVFFPENHHVLKDMGFKVQDRVLLHHKRRFIGVAVNTIGHDFVGLKEVILTQEAMQALGVKFGDMISVSMLTMHPSILVIRKKVDGLMLTYEDYLLLYKAIKDHEVLDLHIASFVTACVSYALNDREVIGSTRAMVDISHKFTWPYEIVADKHCVGGVAGNRVTPIVVSIVAAFGLKIPKTSSKAITSPAGTADTMNVITNVENVDIKAVVEKENGCFVFGGIVNPVDDIIVRVERLLELNVDSQLIASIMSKKIAAGSNHIVIDIPIGPEIKVKTKAQAEALKKGFKAVADFYKVKVEVYFSDGTKPVGRGIGPVQEIKEVLRILQNSPDSSKDLREKALTLAGILIDFVRPSEGYNIAKEILESGKAFEKFKAICLAQGAYKDIPKARFQKALYFKEDGTLTELSNDAIVVGAKLAGAPIVPEAGIYLNKIVGECYKKGEAFLTVYAMSQEALKEAVKYLADQFDFVGRE